MADPDRPTLTAADIMTVSPRTCSVFSSVLEAALIFRDADCGVVPVVEAGEAVGILTDRDVALSLPEFPDLASRPVTDIMTKGVIKVAPDATLEELGAKFGEHGVHRLLVVDAAGQLRGVVAVSDLAPHVSDGSLGHLVNEVAGQS